MLAPCSLRQLHPIDRMSVVGLLDGHREWVTAMRIGGYARDFQSTGLQNVSADS
jgi:hypothetical protein